ACGLAFFHSASVTGLASGSLRAADVMALSSASEGMRVPFLSLGITIHLASIGLAQADDAPTVGAIHESHCVQAQANVANSALARLAVVAAQVGPRQRRLPFQFRRFCQ